MTSRTVSRKSFLTTGAAAAGASLLAGCDLFATEPDRKAGPGSAGAGPARKGKEAPSLAKQVKAGKLPPLDKRLPDKPLVIHPTDRIGNYGGTWHTGILGTRTTWLLLTVGYDHLVCWDPDWKKILPNVAESFEILKDGSEYVFTLRKGMRWSDGELLTADDILFWYDAILTNKALTPVIPVRLQTAGKTVVVEKLDDLHVRFAFTEPNGLFLQELAAHAPFFRLTPRHYLKQFHKDYNPDVAQLAKEAKVPDWMELFLQKYDEWNNTELPTVNGWIPQNPLSDGVRQVFERNPYYFKVDPDGSQLPYIDTISYQSFTEESPFVLAAAHGDIDMYSQSPLNMPRNKPVLARNREAGGFHLIDMKSASMNTMGICLNLTHKDPSNGRSFRIRTSGSASPMPSTGRTSSTSSSKSRAGRGRPRRDRRSRSTTPTTSAPSTPSSTSTSRTSIWTVRDIPSATRTACG